MAQLVQPTVVETGSCDLTEVGLWEAVGVRVGVLEVVAVTVIVFDAVADLVTVRVGEAERVDCVGEPEGEREPVAETQLVGEGVREDDKEAVEEIEAENEELKAAGEVNRSLKR
jgi:hypothetical protein